jgi:hypothetical protein
MLLDDPIQVRIDEVQAGRRAPVTEQPWLDVLARELAPLHPSAGRYPLIVIDVSGAEHAQLRFAPRIG